MSIEIVDVDYADGLLWKPALEEHAEAGQRLLAAFIKEVDSRLAQRIGHLGASTVVRTICQRILGSGHSILGNAFGGEISSLAEALAASEREVILANLAYDLSNNVGCSTFAAPATRGMIHARNLDWPFPRKLLSKHTMVFRTAGAPMGDYAMVGWPGLFGALTGLAPERFSVTVNFVVHEEASGASALPRLVQGYWPVSWLVRRALDECKDYGAAVRLLSTERVLSSVLFTVAGPRRGEAVVIERGPDDYAHRQIEHGCTWVTNHYVSEANEASNCDLSDNDTVERFEFLGSALPGSIPWSAQKALDVLSDDTLESDITQHQVIMFPANGEMVVAVQDGTVEELVVEQRDLEAGCPVADAPVTLDGPGEFECAHCGGTITVDDDGVAHEEMLEVECPSDGELVAVSADEGTYECECGAEIEVEEGHATHAISAEVRCPLDAVTYEYDVDGEWECPGCSATVTVEDGIGEHSPIRRVTCPEKGGSTAVEVDEDADYVCPFCRGAIIVSGGRARHER